MFVKCGFLSWRLRFGCFRNQWYPQNIHVNRVLHYKPSILGETPLFLETSIFLPWIQSPKIAEQFSLNCLRRAPMHLRSQALAFERWEGGSFSCQKFQVPKMVRNPNRNVSCMDMAYVRETLHFWYLKLVMLGCFHQDAEMACNRAAANSQEDRPPGHRCDRCCPRYAHVLNCGCWYFVVPSGDSL